MSSCGQLDKNPQWFSKFLSSLKLCMQNSILSEREIGFDLRGEGGACVCICAHVYVYTKVAKVSVGYLLRFFPILILRPGLSLNQTVSPQAPGSS